MTADSPPGLYDRPVLVIDTGTHGAQLASADVDAMGEIAVTSALDRTVRVWSLVDGRLKRTILLPRGAGRVGMAYGLALSPDGKTVAVGGWTTPRGEKEQVYIFDVSTGVLAHRLVGMPSVVASLAFSADGNLLAAAMLDGAGVRLYDARRWNEIGVDSCYRASSHAVAFAEDGRLATACLDGKIRLYDSSLCLLAQAEAGGERPCDLAFDLGGKRLAVGFGSKCVRVFDGHDLTARPPLDTDAAEDNLGCVTWSRDGAVLYAAGRHQFAGTNSVFAWDGGDGPSRQILSPAKNTIMKLQALPGGGLMVAASDPCLSLIVDDEICWTVEPRKIDLRNETSDIGLSADGTCVDFSYRYWPGERLRFNASSLSMLDHLWTDGLTNEPIQDGLGLSDWENDTPRRNGRQILNNERKSISLAISDDQSKFVIGCSESLEAFSADGFNLWTRDVPGDVWAVNISGDGRLVLAAHHDGTLRWYRVADGVELLALFPMPDRENWVTWTPEGVYAATPGARGVLRWHVNQGWDKAPTAVPVSAIPETHRPDVIPHVLPLLDGAEAIKVAQLRIIREAIQRETGSDVPPGARLHVLAIGVSDYGAAARHLELSHAHRDARDLAAALRNSQSSLYAQVLVSELVNGEGTRAAILGELRAMRDAMARGTDDLAIVLFSGHGTMVDDDQFMLLPHGVDASSRDALEASALPATQFHDRVAALAQHGRVILLLDACRSGGATAPSDRSLRAMLKAPNVTIFTSSSAGQLSVEDDAWQNGAFTEALLEALRQGDPDRDGLVCVSDLSSYLTQRLPALTGGRQRPDIEVRFDGRILVATG